jgi:hypothetical protein
MKNFIMISLTLVFTLMGCSTHFNSIYQEEESAPFQSREYYRTIMNSEEIGAARTNTVTYLNNMEDIVINEVNGDKIHDVSVLIHHDQIIVALKLNAYFRKEAEDIVANLREVLQEEEREIKFAVEPRDYRQAVKLQGLDTLSRQKEWEALYSNL